MSIGPKEEQVKALRLAREKRWKAPQGSLDKLHVDMAKLKAEIETIGTKPSSRIQRSGTKRFVTCPNCGCRLTKYPGGRPPLGDRAMTGAERKRKYRESLKYGRQQKG